MFLDFFYKLKIKKIPVSTSELIDLLKIVKFKSDQDGFLSVADFYTISRNCLVKDLKYFDDFDLVFSETFKDLTHNLNDWLETAIEKELSEEQKNAAANLDFETVLKRLSETFKEQKERHDGGNKWIGTKGTSPFGNSGFNPNGVRIGGGSGGGSAFDSIGERNFREYRFDEALQVRQLKIALKNLKDLRKEGRYDFSIDQSIKKTCNNGGDLELVFERSRKNKLKLILLMDVGGSMSPHAERVSKLFSAAHQLNHFQTFEYFYFHNMIYEAIYEDASFQKKILIRDFYKKFSQDTKIIFVGDASMHSYEFFQKTGLHDFYGYKFLKNKPNNENIKTGQQRLIEIQEHFPACIWLNPEPKRYWSHETVEGVADIIPMFFLSIEGISKGIDSLLNR